MIYALVFSVVHFKYNEKFDHKKYFEKKKEPKRDNMQPERDITKRNTEVIPNYCEFHIYKS